MPSTHANNGPTTNAQWVRKSVPSQARVPSLSAPDLLTFHPPHPNPGPAMPPPSLPVGAISGVRERERLRPAEGRAGARGELGWEGRG